MANSKLHDDLVNEIEPHENAEDSIKALCLGIADRIEACHGNVVKLSDLATVLRENPEAVGNAALANTPAAKVTKTRTTSGFDAPSTAFERPRENVRDGMANSTNDHRDQVFPETSKTEEERLRIQQEQRIRDRGGVVSVNEDMPEITDEQRKADEKAKTDTEAKQRGELSPA